MEERFPLQWPAGWYRTRIQDRRSNGSWRKPLNACYEALEKELKRSGASSMLISTNIPPGKRGLDAHAEHPLDPGVAIFFDRKPKKEDFSWQDVLELYKPAPTVNEITDAYVLLARKYHPDVKPTGDLAMFQKVAQARDAALRYINRESKKAHQYAIACDAFQTVAENLTALRMTLTYIRGLERCGTSSLLERTFSGFAILPEDANAATTVAAAQS
jgi:hypothetical protein